MSRHRVELTISADLDHDNGDETRARDDAAWGRLVAQVRELLARPEFADIEPWIIAGGEE